MFLLTDDQTIEDLRLFAKRERTGIYDIYNNTSTRGGEMQLEKMFRNPLSDLEEINRRAGIIAAYAKTGALFPFNASLLDSVEKYISHGDDAHEAKPATLGDKEISTGVISLIELLHAVMEFIQKGAIAQIPMQEAERKTILDLLLHPALEPIFREKPGGRISFGAVTAYDMLLRGKERGKINTVLQFIYQTDVYISVAQVANNRKFVFPVAHPRGSNILKAEGVYHPELKEPVANDLHMHAGKSVIFLTGANMAGKSTFLRAFSTAVYIAHMGFPVAARSLKFSVMDGVLTTINLPDNLGIGASHFYAEVLRVKKVAAELGAGKSLFVLFDELFRGTNVKDAHEGTVAVTMAFAGKKNSLFLISSHIVEAGNELKKKPNIGFQYLPTRMNGTIPEYTYTLEEGITDDRHGMVIIRNEGILESLATGKKK